MSLRRLGPNSRKDACHVLLPFRLMASSAISAQHKPKHELGTCACRSIHWQRALRFGRQVDLGCLSSWARAACFKTRTRMLVQHAMFGLAGPSSYMPVLPAQKPLETMYCACAQRNDRSRPRVTKCYELHPRAQVRSQASCLTFSDFRY